MTITVVDFKLRFPEFDSIPDARIQLYIDDSELFLSTCAWGPFYNLAQSYYVAANVQTFVVQENDPSTAAAITNKTVAQLSVGMSVTAISIDNGDTLFLSNKYGQRYLQIRDQVIMGIFTVASGPLEYPTGGCY